MINPEHTVDINVIEKAVSIIIGAFGIDLNDPNFIDTPSRTADALVYTWLVGYTERPEDVFTTFPNDSGEHDMVVVKDIPIYSMCAHHMAPFFGKGAVAYVPNGKVVGLSKMSRIIDVFARRLQLQELITKQVADSIEELLDPLGVMVVLYNMEHTCMTSRGVKAHGSTTTTSAVRGVFTEAIVRQEALTLIFGGT